MDFIDTTELYTPFSYQCAKIAEKLKFLVTSVIETIPKHISLRLSARYLHFSSGHKGEKGQYELDNCH